MTDSGYTLETARIDWEGESPRSLNYQDIYWGKGNPLEEKNHVYPARHDIERRARSAAHFTIVETGFGFGNNFLLTARKWRDTGAPGILHYIATENRPVSLPDLERHFSEHRIRGARWLLDHYPPPLRTVFCSWMYSNIRLILILDDTRKAMKQLTAEVDAWYLDGFKPSRNTEQWNTGLYRTMLQLSRPGATLSTYTVAGKVRRELAHAGFCVRKTRGFAGKAEMLVGSAPGQWVPAKTTQADVAIAGAGLAGRACERALRRRSGIRTVLISDQDTPAASSLPALAVYPSTGLQYQPRYAFSLSASHYTRHDHPGFVADPVTWQSSIPDRRARMQGIAACFPDEYLSVTDREGARFHQAGRILTSADPDSPRINARVGSAQREQGRWVIRDVHGHEIASVDLLVIAMGWRSSRFCRVPLIPVRGQALSVRLAGRSHGPIIGDFGLVPAQEDLWLLGSTFERFSTDTTPCEKDTRYLLDQFRRHFPKDSVEVTARHTGIRGTTRDRLPLVGRVPEPVTMGTMEPGVTRQPGLYVLAGLGSHGATHAGLCGEYLANLICNEPLVLPARQQTMLAPERFLVRDRNRKGVE